MRWGPFLVCLLVLAAACIVEDKPVVPPIDGGVEAGKCVVCPPTKPVCLNDTECVQCAGGEDEDKYCTDRDQVCDVENYVCVDCLTNAQCAAPDASRCNTDDNECAPCKTSEDCDDVQGLAETGNICDEGLCVQCTPETEGQTCPNNTSCDPRTNTCTDTVVGSLLVCDECVADNECGDDGKPSNAYKCVPMYYPDEQTRFPNDETGFCLKSIELGGSCTNPYRIVLTRTSLSDAAPEDYCGINEDLTTCPAVRALLADTPCNPVNGDQDCPQPAGLCRELPGMVDRCTYLCSSIVECQIPGATCGSSGSGSDDYCGG